MMSLRPDSRGGGGMVWPDGVVGDSSFESRIMRTIY